MLRLLRFLVFGDGHLHKWEPYGEVTHIVESEQDKIPYKNVQAFKCETCGKIRQFRV